MCGQGSLRLKKWRIQVPIRRDTDLRLLTCFPRCPEGSSWNLKVGAGELGARRGLGGASGRAQEDCSGLASCALGITGKPRCAGGQVPKD